MTVRGGADVTEDRALHARRLEALIDHLPALVASWDRDCKNVFANAAYVEWFGWTPEAMHGTHIREVLGAEVYSKNLPFITGVLAGVEQFFERTLVDASGRVRHTQASYTPDVVDGETVGFFVLVTDITPTIEAKRALDEAQQLARIGSWTIKPEIGFVAWSEELYRIFEVDPDTFVPTAESIAQRIDTRDLERVRAQFVHAYESGEPYDLSYRILTDSGITREVHSQAQPWTGPDGKVVRITGTMQDVTASNAAARELSRVNGELRDKNQLNADVIAMLGHDVRTPLTVILGYLEELDTNWDEISESRRRDGVARAFKSARRLSSLIGNILAMATLESDQVRTKPTDLSVLDQVREAVDAIGCGADVVVTADGAPRAFADPFHVRQAVSNLVTNAIRYGEPPVEIHIGSRDLDTVTISVSDHGPGVPTEQVETIFQRFTQASDQSIARPGTGLGLYIAAGLVAANNGSVVYEHNDDLGARFCLNLPRKERAGQ